MDYSLGSIIAIEKLAVRLIIFPGDDLSFLSGGFINLFVFSILHSHYKVGVDFLLFILLEIL